MTPFQNKQKELVQMELKKVYSGMELNDLIEWVDEQAEEVPRTKELRIKLGKATVNAKTLLKVLKKLRQHKAVSVKVDIQKTKAVEWRTFGESVDFSFVGAAISYELPGGAKGTITVA